MMQGMQEMKHINLRPNLSIKGPDRIDPMGADIVTRLAVKNNGNHFLLSLSNLKNNKICEWEMDIF